MKKRLAILGLVGLLIASPFMAQAIIPVFDEASFTQMIIDFAYSVADYAIQGEQLAQQVLEVENTILMLEDWALALKQLDWSALPIIGEPLGSLQAVFEKASSAFYNAALIQEKFKELYSDHFAFSLDQLMEGDAYFAKAFDWNEAVRQSHQIAMEQQAQLPDSLEMAKAALLQGLDHSETAVGPLQAAQAGNQILGIQVQQGNTTNALLGTMAQQEATKNMLEASARQQMLLRMDYALQDFTYMEPVEGLATLPTSFR